MHSGASVKRGVNESRLRFPFVLYAATAWLALPNSLHACAACYGQSDSPLASGVTWGILSLLVVVMGVLGSIVTFFVYMNKKSAAAMASQAFPTATLTHHASDITSIPSPVTNH